METPREQKLPTKLPGPPSARFSTLPPLSTTQYAPKFHLIFPPRFGAEALRKRKTGSVLAPFTSILLIKKKLPPSRFTPLPLTNFSISLAEPGSSLPNWLHGKARIRSPFFPYFSSSDFSWA